MSGQDNKTLNIFVAEVFVVGGESPRDSEPISTFIPQPVTTTVVERPLLVTQTFSRPPTWGSIVFT